MKIITPDVAWTEGVADRIGICRWPLFASGQRISAAGGSGAYGVPRAWLESVLVPLSSVAVTTSKGTHRH